MLNLERRLQAGGGYGQRAGSYTTKDGTRKQTKPQYKFQTCGGRGKQKLRHIPAALVPKVKRLIENGRKVERLESEYARLVTEASLDALKKRLRGRHSIAFKTVNAFSARLGIRTCFLPKKR